MDDTPSIPSTSASSSNNLMNFLNRGLFDLSYQHNMHNINISLDFFVRTIDEFMLSFHFLNSLSGLSTLIEEYLMRNVYQAEDEEKTYELDISPVQDMNITNFGERCPICYEHFTQDSKIILLECTHYYHQECISAWVSRVPSCPLCRQTVPNREVVTPITLDLDSIEECYDRLIYNDIVSTSPQTPPRNDAP